jgi:hypothetical protein
MKLAFKVALLFASIASSYCLALGQTSGEIPQKVTVCQLLDYPKLYDHKLVEVTGFASHGFEDSGFSDPSCGGRYGGLWMEFGGRTSTGTMSTVSGLNRARPEPAVVEGLAVPLIEDATFHRFDDLLHQGNGNLVHAQVIARFFAGKENLYGRKGWSGYGHMGCCSLFLIQQVLSVDEDRRQDFDYTGEPSQPNASCYTFLTPIDNQAAERKAQRAAESGNSAYAFTDPDRVLREEVASRAGISDTTKIHLERISSSSARIVYEASVSGAKTRYTVTLSRPYWLSVDAADRSKVAWVVLATIATCEINGAGGTVQRLK